MVEVYGYVVATPSYRIRRALRAPRAAYMRRKMKNLHPITRAQFEFVSYRRSAHDFLKATIRKPDLILDVGADAESIIFDVGAFTGDWAEKVSVRSGAKIYSFEPSPEALPALHRRLDQYPNVTICEYALGARDASMTLADTGPGSTLYGSSTSVDLPRVAVRDIVGVIEELELDHVDVIKMNIEGGEYDVLERLADTGWLPKIGLVSVQFHEWLPRAHRRRRAIRHALARSHTLVWEYPWVWELWKRDGDAQV